jgi:DNA-binding NarL/FixJ family response regulator
MADHPDDSARPLTLLLIEDHHLVREGLKLTVQTMDRQIVIHEADTVAQGVQCYRAHPEIDLVLLDLTLSNSAPATFGLMSLETFYAACPDAKVVVISATHDLRTVQSAMRRGVSGFIPKIAGPAAILNALRFVLNGDVYVPPEVFVHADTPPPTRTPPMTRGVGPKRPADTPHAAGLTVRQIEVLRLLLEGKSNKTICLELDLAIGTVKSHVAAILHTLGAESRSQAVAAVESFGWRAMIVGNPNLPK